MDIKTLLDGAVIAPIDPEAVNQCTRRLQELIATNDVLMADGMAALEALQQHINAWESNRQTLVNLMAKLNQESEDKN